MPADNPHDVVRLVTASNPAEAHIWQQALQDEGITCKVVGDYLDAGIGDVPGVGPELWVHRDDVDRAREVLRQHQEMGGEKQAETED